MLLGPVARHKDSVWNAASTVETKDTYMHIYIQYKLLAETKVRESHWLLPQIQLKSEKTVYKYGLDLCHSSSPDIDDDMTYIKLMDYVQSWN